MKKSPNEIPIEEIQETDPLDDPLRRIKHIGYCLSQPPHKREKVGLADFVNYARFQICEARKVLFWDPVWENYTDEQILAEYYAVLFSRNKEVMEEFEGTLLGAQASDVKWLLDQSDKAKKELKKLEVAKEVEELFDETPESLLKED